MPTSRRVLTTKKTVNLSVNAPYLAVFAKPNVFHKKYCLLQAGSNLIPYYGGKTDCWLYTVQQAGRVLAGWPKAKKPTVQMIHDVPTP